METIKNRGWQVTFAGMGINLALGVLYSWSVVSKGIPDSWGWSETQKALPYSIACMLFALAMVPAGRAQDRFGPRWVALAGGFATGLGLILASFTTSVLGFIAGFGVLAGIGIGMGYAAATPAAVKWFPPQRTGLVAGLVVAGFGLASVYISPLAKYLMGTFGVSTAMFILGAAFLVAVSLLSQLLVIPPPGYRPPAPAAAASSRLPAAEDVPWTRMVRTPQFFLLWLMYAFAAGAGLMIIAKLAKIVAVQGNLQAGFIFVALLAVGNAGGRVLAGLVSDRIGRVPTMLVFFLFQAALMFAMPFVRGEILFGLLSVLLGMNYGANLSLFPAVTKDYFGLKNFGVNYGWVFTAWGVGGFVFPTISGWVFDTTKKFHTAYLVAGVCLVVAAGLALALRPPARPAAPVAPPSPSGWPQPQPGTSAR